MIRPDAAYGRIKQRHKDLHPEPLFDITAAPAAEPKQKTPRPYTRLRCPACSDLVSLDAKRGSDLRRVLIWRTHYRKTIGGAQLLCRLSATEYAPTPPPLEIANE